MADELKELSLAFLSGLIGSETYRQKVIEYIKNNPFPNAFKIMASVRVYSYTQLRDLAHSYTKESSE